MLEGLNIPDFDRERDDPEFLEGNLAEQEVSVGEDLKKLLGEQALRNQEALRLYEPTSQMLGFHKSLASERIVRGGRRSGKTMSTMIELAMAVTGQHPWLPYPKKDGRVILVGYKWTHVGTVFYQKLFKPGAFKIIKDLETGQWRAYRPWLAEDAAREKDVKPAPPLIPARLVKRISWGKRSENIFTRIEFTNGWEILAFSSDATPPVGMDVDLVVIDEDVKIWEWITEMQMRLADRKGRFVWGTAPYLKNTILREMCDRAADEALDNPGQPDIQEFVLRFRDNPHIDEDEKRKTNKRLKDREGAIDLYDLGEWAGDVFLRWPTFSLEFHGINRSDLPGGQVPRDWCRYMIVDPGTTVAAVLFAVIPPPEVGSIILLEGELYIRRCTADEFGRRVSAYMVEKHIQDAVIDEHGSRIQEAGSGLTVKKQYSDAMRQYGIKAFRTGYGFIPGCDNIRSRELAVDSLLASRGGGERMTPLRGGPRLRFLRGELPNFEKEIMKFNRNVIDEVIQEEGNYKRDAHLMACLGYLAAHEPKYVKPKKRKRVETWGERRMKERQKKLFNQSGGRSISLGPSTGQHNRFQLLR